MFQTKITSQGTISIPAVLRRKYDLKPGELVTIEDNGKITITKNTDFSSLRQMNAPYLENKPDSYKNGDGLAAHVLEKYGQ
jgi:AbrB family looped-hinge helix DNA binding protein